MSPFSSPGLAMETYLSDDLEYVTLEVLRGTLLVSEPQDTSTKANLNNFARILYTWKKSCSVDDDQLPKPENQWQGEGSWDDSTGILPRMTWMKDAYHSLILGSKDRVLLPTGYLYNIITISPDPAFYMFTYTNSTLKKGRLKTTYLNTQAEIVESTGNLINNMMTAVDNELQNFPSFGDFRYFLERKMKQFYQSGKLLYQAIFCIPSNTCISL